MKYSVQYGLYEDQSREFTRECNSLEEVHIFLSVMEGLLSWYEIYNENGEEIEPELWIENNLGLLGGSYG